MNKIVNLRDFLLEQLRELFSVEQQQLGVLPKLRDKATSQALCNAIDVHISETKAQVARLHSIFEELGEAPKVEKSRAMTGLILHTYDLADRCSDMEVLDVVLITCIQHLNHYEIASY